MATRYSSEQIATMTAEFKQTADRLGIELPGDPARLVELILDASARWGSTSGCRAIGPFGTFLAGAATPPAFDLVEGFVAPHARRVSPRT
jgi:hypothetical protein